jgi:hypothetical protein
MFRVILVSLELAKALVPWYAPSRGAPFIYTADPTVNRLHSVKRCTDCLMAFCMCNPLCHCDVLSSPFMEGHSTCSLEKGKQ